MNTMRKLALICAGCLTLTGTQTFLPQIRQQGLTANAEDDNYNIVSPH